MIPNQTPIPIPVPAVEQWLTGQSPAVIVLSLVVAGMWVMIMRQYKANTEIQESRIADAKEAVKGLVDASNAMSKLQDYVHTADAGSQQRDKEHLAAVLGGVEAAKHSIKEHITSLERRSDGS